MFKDVAEQNRDAEVDAMERRMREKDYDCNMLQEQLMVKNNENGQLLLRIKELEGECKNYQNKANSV